jgi:steroid delta-isomerase-like uncharacterized protein
VDRERRGEQGRRPADPRTGFQPWRRGIDQRTRLGRVSRTVRGRASGPDAFIATIDYFRFAFPDLHFTLDDLTAEDDKVFASGTMTGTHRGAFMTVEPTGRSISARAVTAYRIRDGKWVEGWGNWDLAGTLQQLGAPIPGWYTGDEG